jgi:hypothetical protein
MSLFDRIKSVTTSLVPTRTIPTAKTINTGAVEQGLQGAIQADNKQSQASNARIQELGQISNTVMGVAKDATVIRKDMDHGLFNQLSTQQHSAYALAMTQLQNSSDPHDIAAISAHLTATIEGINTAGKGLPNNYKNSLDSYGSNYGGSAASYAAKKNNTLSSEHDLNVTSNSVIPTFQALQTSMANETDPKKKQALLDTGHNILQHLEDGKKYLPRGLWTKSDATIQRVTIQLNKLAHPEKYQDADNNVIDQGTSISSSVLGASASNANVQKQSFYSTGDPADIATMSKHPLANLQPAMEVRQARNMLGKVRYSYQAAMQMANSTNPNTAYAGKQFIDMVKHGNARVLADTMSPKVNAAHQAFATAGHLDQKVEGNVDKYKEALSTYQDTFKSWVHARGLPDSAFNPLSGTQTAAYTGIQTMAGNDLSAKDKQDAADSLINTGGRSKWIGMGAGSLSYGLSDARFWNSKDGKVSFPGSLLQSNFAWGDDNRTKVASEYALTFQKADGDIKKNLSSLKNITANVAENYSNFSIGKMSVLTGIPQDEYVKHDATLIAMKMNSGESFESASADMQNMRKRQLSQHPIYSAPSSGFFSGYTNRGYTINPATAEENGMHGVQKEDYQGVVNNLVKDSYSRFAHSGNIATGITGGSAKFDEDMKVKANKENLGDENDCTVISTNGKLVMIDGKGMQHTLTAADVKKSVHEMENAKNTESEDFKSKLEDKLLYGEVIPGVG